jgi:hypothetical protein
MNKKDYDALVAALRNARIPEHVMAAAQWAAVVNEISLALKSDNPKFREDKFIEACKDKK